MPFAIRTEKMTPLDLQLAEKLEKDAARWLKGGMWSILAFMAGVIVIASGFYWTRVSPLVGVSMIVTGVLCVAGRGGFVFFRAMGRSLAKLNLQLIRDGIARGEVTVIEIDADRVIPAPSLDEDEDVAFFRIGPDGYAWFGEDTLSRFHGWLDGRYPAKFTMRLLSGGEILSVVRGTNVARVDAPLSEGARDRILQYRDAHVEQILANPESEPEIVLVIPAEVVEE